MRRFFPWLVMLAALCGCERSNPYLEVFREQDEARKELIKVLRTIKDEAGMEAAKEELTRRFAFFDAVSAKPGRMLPPSREVMQRLEEERPAMEKTMLELMAEANRVKELPGGENFIRSVGGLRNTP